MHKKLNMREKIKAYKLETQVYVTIIMLVIFILSLIAYQISALRENNIISNILIAFFTSLFVTIFTLIADIIVRYHNHKNDKFLEDIHLFGIQNLHLNKTEALRSLLLECKNVIWISGYRLILTCELKKEIYDSIIRGADIKAVICPPWSEAFKMVYGSNEKVADNYLKVFSVINNARKVIDKSENQIEISFVDKPIFSDTYRVDEDLITGPYMHNLDSEFRILMAKDFFSYNITPKSKLYEIVDTEYKTLCSQATLKLNWENFEIAYNEIESGDKCESEKIEALRSACEEVGV